MTETQEKEIKITMKEVAQFFVNNPTNPADLVFWKLVGDGAFYIANKNHKLARGSIVFPKEICSDNLKTLNDWFIILVAIPSTEMNEYIKKRFDS